MDGYQTFEKQNFLGPETMPELRFPRECRCCGRKFWAPANNTLNCPECRKVLRSQQSAEAYKRFLAKEEIRKLREKLNKGNTEMDKEKDGVPISYWAAALNMLARKTGISYGKIGIWAHFHETEYGKWMDALRQCYQKSAAEGKTKKGVIILPEYVPKSLPHRNKPEPHGWGAEKHYIWD